MKRNNKGFSLVEMIVIVAILGILVGVFSTSIMPLLSQRAERAAKSTNDLLSKCKVYSMSRAGEIYVRLRIEPYKKVNNIIAEYYEGTTLIESEILATGRTILTVNGTALNTNSLWISFSRSTGAIDVFGTQNSSTPPSGVSPLRIGFADGNKAFEVQIIPSTGKHEVVRTL